MSSLSQVPMNELKDKLIELGKRWQKAEMLDKFGNLPYTKITEEELCKIVRDTVEIWEFLEQHDVQMLSGVGFLGFADINIETLKRSACTST